MAVITEWTKRDSTKVKIADMDDDHLNNAILMLDRKGMWAFRGDLKHTLLFLNSEKYLENASEHVVDAVLREGDCVTERLEQGGVDFVQSLRMCTWLPAYEALLAERDRRIQESRWTCTGAMHANYDVGAKHESLLYACSVHDDLTLGGKGDSV